MHREWVPRPVDPGVLVDLKGANQSCQPFPLLLMLIPKSKSKYKMVDMGREVRSMAHMLCT